MIRLCILFLCLLKSQFDFVDLFSHSLSRPNACHGLSWQNHFISDCYILLRTGILLAAFLLVIPQRGTFPQNSAKGVIRIFAPIRTRRRSVHTTREPCMWTSGMNELTTKTCKWTLVSRLLGLLGTCDIWGPTQIVKDIKSVNGFTNQAKSEYQTYWIGICRLICFCQ